MRREKLEHGMTTDTFCVKIAEGKRGGEPLVTAFHHGMESYQKAN